MDVTRSTAEMLRLQRELVAGAIKTNAANQGKARLLLEDGTLYPLPGTLKFSDVSVDPSTGFPRIKFFAQRRYRANWPFMDGH